MIDIKELAMAKTDDLQQTLYDAAQILERAMLILGGAPFFVFVAEREFASIIIDGDKATVYWPEVQSGYYDSTSIERQSTQFPSELLLMSIDEITAWKIDQRKKYDAAQKLKSEQEDRVRAERQRELEMKTLAALKAKYEAPRP